MSMGLLGVIVKYQVTPYATRASKFLSVVHSPVHVNAHYHIHFTQIVFLRETMEFCPRTPGHGTPYLS